MTIFTGEDDVLPTPSVMDLKSSLGEGMGATFSEGFMSGARQIAGIGELAGAEHAGERYVPAEGEGTFPSELPLPPMGTFEKLPGTAPDLPIATAKSKVTEAGLDHILKLPDQPTIKPGVLDIMLTRARHENEVAATMARGPQGVTVSALNAATALAAGAVDPLNIAAALIPGVPEAQAARLMAAAGRNVIARAGARAAIGGIQGAEFSAAMVPLDWYAKSQEGQDFTAGAALRQILLGAATFGAIHPVAGVGADIARAWRGRPLYPFAPGDIHGRYATPAAPGETPGEPLRQAPQAAEPPADDAAARGASASGEARTEGTPAREAGAPEPGGPQSEAGGGLEGESRVPAGHVRLYRGENPLNETNGGYYTTDREMATGFGTLRYVDLPTDAAKFFKMPGMDDIYNLTNYEAGPGNTNWRSMSRLVGPLDHAIGDLPANVQTDNLRMAIARMTTGEPVDVAETLQELAKTDPRIAESLALARVPPVDTGAQAVHADVAAQLRAVGMSEEEVEHNAAIVAARYATRAQRLGHPDAFALYHSEGLSIRGAGGDIADDPDLAARIYGQGGGDLFAEREAKGQESLPGTERIGEGELAQRRADQALKPKVAQKPMDEGLFGDSAAQKTLFQSARQAPPFYSALERAVTASKQEKASPDQWLGMLKNTPGVKHEEMDWLGLPDWLKEQKGPVTKQQIADYVRANSVEVRGVAKGGPPDLREVRISHLDAEIRVLSNWPTDSETARNPAQQEQLNAVLAEWDAIQNDATPSPEPVKFGSYQLPGGENYRELLLTLPDEETTAAHVERKRRWRELDDKFIQQELSSEEQAEKKSLFEQIYAAESGRDIFRGSHWEEPNVLAHIRFNDRTIDGKKTLFIEEIQSDWHQQGKRRSYKGEKPEDPGNFVEFAARHGVGRDDAKRIWNNTPNGDHPLLDRFLKESDAYIEAAGRHANAVPDAPFKTSWPELSLKRMIRYAAEHGYDQVAWTPGKVQAERYDLSKQINALHIMRDVANKNFHVEATTTNGARADIAHNVEPAKLEEYVGKDLAKKIVEDFGENSTAPRTYSGLDLRIGGEGMHGFYDKILPAAANKLVKKFGAKVDEAKIKHLDQTDRDVPFIVLDRDGTVMQADIFDENYAAQEARAIGGTYEFDRTAGVTREETVHTLPLTEPLRNAAVGEGFPLFQGGESGPRGRIMLGENKAIIDLFKSADASTFVHEMGHKWLDEMARDAGHANVPQALKDDLGTVLRWLGVDKAEDIGTAQHEQWARGFEQYLSEGVAPSARLAAAFEKFKQWLAGIYRAIAGRDVPISDDIRKVMGRMLATDEEIASRAEPAAVHVARRPARGPAARPEATWSLFEFLAARGGLKPDPELAAIFGGRNPLIPGFGPLMRQTGMALDHAREASVEAGYLHDAAQEHGGVTESTVNHLLDALGTQERGTKVYRAGNQPEAKRPGRSDHLDEIEHEMHGALVDAGIDVTSEPDKRMARVLQIMDREGVHDPIAAYERAVMEEDRNAIDHGRAGPHGPIAGWDVPDDRGAAPGAGRGPAGPGAGRPGEGPRQRGAVDRAQAEALWRKLADAGQRDPDAAAALAAQRATEKLPVPESTQAEIPDGAKPGEQSPATKDAVRAAAEADAMWANIEPYMTPEERESFATRIAAAEQDSADRTEVARRGAACLTMAVG